jgi:tryptophanyl-tRNA synthetase
MVHWKSKAHVSELSSINSLNDESLTSLQLGLFAYPALQAADILIHNADFVPMGENQSQHLELTTYIASTFNHRFGKIFPTSIEIIGLDY